MQNYEVLEFDNVQINAEGLIFQKNRILKESFFRPSNFEEWTLPAKFKSYLKNYLPGKRKKMPRVLWLTDDWSESYFHWMFNVLPKIEIYSDYLHSSVFLMPNSFRKQDYILMSLKLFDIENFAFIDENDKILCDKLILPKRDAQAGLYDKPIIKNIRRTFISKISEESDEDVSDKIYVSRRKADKRSELNEEEYSDMLKSYGFKIICAEDYSFLEQIRIFKSAKYLVSIHGAGFTNMLFMPENGKVLELRKEDKKINNAINQLASVLDMDYSFLSCQSNNMSDDIHIANLIVDKLELEKKLEIMLSKKE